MLTLVKLTNAEYLITSVASGLEDYYVGSGEAPGVWHGRWAKELNLTGVVGDDQLRAIVGGYHPATGVDCWLASAPAKSTPSTPPSRPPSRPPCCGRSARRK